GMGNNLNQIARRVNAAAGTGQDRLQIVADVMAIHAPLDSLRDSVLENVNEVDR
ncbi:plasmid mobilization relaxosome protein MobC, partial [Enterobacter hormaechei]